MSGGRRLQGLLGLASIGGIAGTILGTAWGVAVGWLGLDGAPLFERLLDFGGLGLISGAACAAGFGALLASLDGRKSLEELPLWRMALFGALVGMALPTVFVLVTSGTANFVSLPGVMASIAAVGGVLGGGMAAGLVGVAKRAHSAEFTVVDEVARLADRST